MVVARPKGSWPEKVVLAAVAGSPHSETESVQPRGLNSVCCAIQPPPGSFRRRSSGLPKSSYSSSDDNTQGKFGLAPELSLRVVVRVEHGTVARCTFLWMCLREHEAATVEVEEARLLLWALAGDRAGELGPNVVVVGRWNTQIE